MFAPSPIGKKTLDAESLKNDRHDCRKFGPCGVGREALYLGGRFLDRRYYIPWKEVKRVFKRVAMSKGGYTGKGVFGSLPFLVVQFGSGGEKECPFKFEADIDRLLACVEQEHPDIPTHSVKAQNKLAKAEAAEEARFLKELSPEAQAAVQHLQVDKEFLEKRPSLSNALTNSARQKRVVDSMKPIVRVIGAILALVGVLCILYGLYGLLTHSSPYAVYFLVGGGAAFFISLSSNTMPNKYNSKKRAQAEWDDTVHAMQNYLIGRPGFPVPAQYAHPAVLERMIRVLREGRAQTIDEAYGVMKEDLKKLNSSVAVSQKEYDEVVAVKPMFLVCEYKDEI